MPGGESTAAARQRNALTVQLRSRGPNRRESSSIGENRNTLGEQASKPISRRNRIEIAKAIPKRAARYPHPY